MKRMLIGVAIAVIAGQAFADPMTDLARSKQCFSCHEISGQLLAKPFDEISLKYKGVKNAEIYLAGIIHKGALEHFGPDLMPSEAARVVISQAEAQALAGWILSLKQ